LIKKIPSLDQKKFRPLIKKIPCPIKKIPKKNPEKFDFELKN